MLWTNLSVKILKNNNLIFYKVCYMMKIQHTFLGGKMERVIIEIDYVEKSTVSYTHLTLPTT